MKQFRKIFLLTCLSILSITACTKEDPQEVEEAQDLKDQNVEEELVEEPGESTEEDKDVEEALEEVEIKNLVEEDGNYSATLYEQDQGESENESPTVYEVHSNGEILVVKGSLSYNKSNESTENNEAKFYINQEYAFTVTDNTIYLAELSEEDPSELDMNEFNDYVNQVLDSGVTLTIEVENGVVKEIIISS